LLEATKVHDNELLMRHEEGGEENRTPTDEIFKFK
jgi:hypothetical protein